MAEMLEVNLAPHVPEVGRSYRIDGLNDLLALSDQAQSLQRFQTAAIAARVVIAPDIVLVFEHDAGLIIASARVCHFLGPLRCSMRGLVPPR